MSCISENSKEIAVEPSVEKSQDVTRCSLPDKSPALSSRATHARDLMAPVVHHVLSEIHSMWRVLGRYANEFDFANLEQSALASLARIERLIAEGKIEPLVRIRHSEDSQPLSLTNRELRIGIFPTAADPLHWGHLLGGLIAMEQFRLDKVLFVIAGLDPRKPDMAPEQVRHSMAKKVIDLFCPLFEYSAIALGTAASGEENLFKILGMNPEQSIHAFYIAGGDHYHRFNPATGRPDTIQKLEEGIALKRYGFEGEVHRVSAIFLHREGEEKDIPTTLDVHCVASFPVKTSSTEIRSALRDQHCRRKLYSLPFIELASILRRLSRRTCRRKSRRTQVLSRSTVIRKHSTSGGPNEEKAIRFEEDVPKDAE
jgi:nicotinic acid mononucleotide adenylyltransferase